MKLQCNRSCISIPAIQCINVYPCIQLCISVHHCVYHYVSVHSVLLNIVAVYRHGCVSVYQCLSSSLVLTHWAFCLNLHTLLIPRPWRSSWVTESKQPIVPLPPRIGKHTHRHFRAGSVLGTACPETTHWSCFQNQVAPPNCLNFRCNSSCIFF